MTEEWQSQEYRQSIIAKIHEVIQNSSPDPSKNATVMESHVFKKARTKEEYLSLVAKLFIHFREMGNRPGKTQPQPTHIANNNIMQDPINALQNLASQGSRNTQMMAMNNQNNQIAPGSVIGGNVAASNLLQTLTQQQRPGQQMQNMQGIRQMNVPMGANMAQNNMGPANMGPQMGGNLGNMNNSMNINIGPMGNQTGQLGNCIPGQLNQMPTSQMQMTAGMQGQPINSMNGVPQMPMNTMSHNQINVGMNHPQMNQIMGRMNANAQVNVVPNGLAQTTMSNQLNVPTNMSNMNAQPQLNQAAINANNQVGLAQNAAQMNTAGGINKIMNVQNIPQKPQNVAVGNNNIFQTTRNVGQNQFLRQSPSPTVSSPAGISQQHQNSQMIPSPALVTSSSPQMSNIMANSQRALRQSPNAPLNTPGQVANSSPFSAQEDQMYREKYKQLTKYIEPLKRMVAKIGNDDVEKISKMNKLLEILCNPQQRIPLETLLKCEKALEKMDINSSLFVSSGNQFGSNNPLQEAVSATLQSPIGNHTLQRTFRPCLEALFGSDIKSFPPAAKQPRLSIEDSSSFNPEIPHVLQGEIARLDQKFKISLDLSSQNNNKTIKLICCLDDKRLPCVPPVSVSIPEEYPLAAPNCSLTEQEYSATPFLMAVQNALTSRISKMPKCYSLSHLLDTWEMSVRQACSPASVPPTEFSTLIGA